MTNLKVGTIWLSDLNLSLKKMSTFLGKADLFLIQGGFLFAGTNCSRLCFVELQSRV